MKKLNFHNFSTLNFNSSWTSWPVRTKPMSFEAFFPKVQSQKISAKFIHEFMVKMAKNCISGRGNSKTHRPQTYHRPVPQTKILMILTISKTHRPAPQTIILWIFFISKTHRPSLPDSIRHYPFGIYLKAIGTPKYPFIPTLMVY